MKAFNYQNRDAEGIPSCTIFELRGYIDAHTVIEFEKAVNGVIDGGKSQVILDISGLSYISSAGIGAMMGLARRLSQHGGDLVLLNPTPKVFAILEGLGFTRIFKIAETEDEAREKLKGSATST
jgi:anti-anti-sigma factor